MKNSIVRGNGPAERAGDKMRKAALQLGESAQEAVAAARKRLEMLEEVAEKLRHETTERYEVLANQTEAELEKSDAALEELNRVAEMLKEPRALPPREERLPPQERRGGILQTKADFEPEPADMRRLEEVLNQTKELGRS